MLEHLHLIKSLHHHYQIDTASLTPLPGGADQDASVYKAISTDQKAYFVKLKRGHQNEIKIAILELLQQANIQEIVPPIKTVHGKSAAYINDFTLTVFPFINGQDGFRHPLSDLQWMILGRTLRKIHDIDVPQLIQNQIRQEDFSPKWRNAVRSLYARLKAPLPTQMYRFLKENQDTIDKLIHRAEILSQKIQKEELSQFVLCHADLHGGNVLIDENDSLYIIDWDDPIMAPKERDLMFIGGGVGNVWNKIEEENFFYEGYGKTEINGTRLSYYRHERIIEDISEYGEALLWQDSEVMYKQFIAMFEPNGVVDIAFKTEMNS